MNKKVTRQDIANPFIGTSLEEKRNKANSIILNNNFIFLDLGNGYGEIIPIDVYKRFKNAKHSDNKIK